jgi:hypothetical protein
MMTSSENEDRGASSPLPLRHQPKIQLGLGLSAETLARLDRLRACTGLTRGEVIEAALTGQGIAALEHSCEEAGYLDRFQRLADDIGMTWQEYARDYASRWSRKTYPPAVTELEKMLADAQA